LSDPHDREPVDQATIDCWRINYWLDKRTPADAARYWADRCSGMAPAGAVAALGIALDDLAALRLELARAYADSVQTVEDAATVARENTLLRKDSDRYRVIRQDHEGKVRPDIALYAGRELDEYVDTAIDRMRGVGAA
jgi:hypothetical protein